MDFLKTISLIFLSLLATGLIAGCGGSGEGQIGLEVRNSRGPAGLPALSKVEGSTLSKVEGSALSVGSLSSSDSSGKLIDVTRFKVTITGEGISPIEVFADASAAGIQIDGIPSGEGRSILIEALNGEGTVIRRRRVDGIEIVPEVVTPVRTSLNTIPLIMNLRPGSTVVSKNLKIIGFGEPGTSVRIDAASSSESVPLSRSAGPASLVVSPAVSTGLFEFKPPSSLMGRQTITVTDEASGESSSIGIYVVKGANRPGQRINAAAATRPVATVGTGLGGKKSAHYPRLLRSLATKPVKEKK